MYKTLAVAAAFMFSTHSAQGGGFLKDMEHGFRKLEHDLCKASGTRKCKTQRKASRPIKRQSSSVKTQVAKPLEAVPQPPVSKPKPAPEQSALARHPPIPRVKPEPAIQPVLPQPKPKPVVLPVSPPPCTPVVPLSPNCLQQLAAIGAQFAPVPQPGTSPACFIENPVRLFAMRTPAGMVKQRDQPIVSCAFALKLQGFLSDTVQPVAQQNMHSPVVTMGTGPGFDCRGRNGDASARLSEHATGHAVDIAHFGFADKTTVSVKDALDVQSKSFAFLRDVRAGACQSFTTVLGPGANAAHAEHFHVDLAQRNKGFRLCE